MAAIEPAQKRSATIVAHDTVVALKVKSSDFSSVGEGYPEIWLPLKARIVEQRSMRFGSTTVQKNFL